MWIDGIESDKNISGAIEMFEKELKQDGNYGLAKTLLQRVRQSKVKDLGDVYITLSFKDIQEKSGLDQDVDVEKFLQKMISKGHLKAEIDRETRTVQFVEDSDMLDLVDSIDQKNRRIVELMRMAADREESMKTDQQYLFEKVKSNAAND